MSASITNGSTAAWMSERAAFTLRYFTLVNHHDRGQLKRIYWSLPLTANIFCSIKFDFMKQVIGILLSVCIFPLYSISQHPNEISGEYKLSFGKNYNAGNVGAVYEVFDNNNSRNTNGANKGSWSLGINYAFSSTRMDKEKAKGKGFGLWMSYRYGLKYGLSGNLYGGIRTAFTFSKDDPGNKYSIFTPSLELGYHYTAQDFGKGGAFTSFVALGYDVKMTGDKKTKALHEGIILSPGITVGYRF